MLKKINYKEAWQSAVIIMALSWPTILEQAMQTAVQYIDTAMVGTLGTHATAAVGSTTTVGWLVFSTISALSIGFLAYIAKACGANDYKTAKKAVSQAVLTVLVVGTLFTIITLGLSGYIPKWMQVDKEIQTLASTYFFILYLPMLPRSATTIFSTVLRGAGDTKTPMKVGLIVNLTNIILNYFLIFEAHTISLAHITLYIPGAGLGVVGAAIASASAFTLGGILITYALWKHPFISFKGSSLKPDFNILRPCAKIAIPNMFQRFGTSLGYVAFASMINSVGEVATAAHTIANTVESAFYIPGYGMQTAAATLTGNAYGAKDQKKMKSLSMMFVPIEVILMIISGGALFIFAPALMNIFSSSEEVISLGTTVLRMVAVTEPLYGLAIIIEGMLMGVGETKKPFIFNIIGMWGVRILGTFICIEFFNLGLISAWACMIAHNILLCLLFVIIFISGSWNPLNKEEYTNAI